MSAEVKITKNFGKVKKVVDNSIITSFSRAAFAIRSTAMRSIRKRVGGEPSPKGQPPRTRFGRLKKSILYSVDKTRQEAVIGPARSKIGPNAARLHEHGGFYKGQTFDARPFMEPALKEVAPRLPSIWRYTT